MQEKGPRTAPAQSAEPLVGSICDRTLHPPRPSPSRDQVVQTKHCDAFDLRQGRADFDIALVP